MKTMTKFCTMFLGLSLCLSSPVGAETAGMRQVIARVHAAGIEIFGGTLNPIKGGISWSPETEVKRQALNAWIVQSGEFVGVVDFAAAVADPSDPEALAPQFDSGDHQHPNDDGYAAMAGAVNLNLFR